MNRAPLSAHGRASVLIVGRRVAEALAAVALDPASDLSRPVRAALVGLVIAVDVEASRRAGIEPMAAKDRADLALALAEAEHARGPP